MTGKDLLTAMSGIDGRYIEEAAPAAAPKTRSLRRPLLVAAAIAALANSLTPFTLLVPAIIILVVAADLRKLPTSSTH